MSNFQNLVNKLANLNPEQVKLRSLGNNKVLITLSSEVAPNIFSIEASEVNGKLVVGNYLLKRNFGQTSTEAIESTVISLLDTLNYHNNQPRGTIGHYLDQAYRSIVQAGTYVSANDAKWTATGALEAMDTARPPLIPKSDVYATHRTNPGVLPANILWVPETSPGAGQSTKTIEQYATLAGVHIEAGSGAVITPFPKAKASKTTSSNRPMSPHPDVITENPLARSVIEQPGVTNITEPMGRAAIHPSWTAYAPPGAAYIPVEHDEDKYGSVGVKTQKIDINRLPEVEFQVTKGAIKRGQVLAKYGNDQIISDQNAHVFNTRIVVPDTNDTWETIAKIKNAGGAIDSKTGLPVGWEFGGTGKSAQIVFDVERWRTIGLSGGVSHKNWGYKSFAVIRDTREISTPINPVTGQPMADYSQPNLEMGFESQKGSSGVQSLGLLLGSQYRQRALEEIRIHKPFLYNAVNKPTLSLDADEDKLVEAAEFLFYKREWTKDLPYGGVTRFYDPVLGTATLSKDESHGMIPAKALSYLSQEQEVGFGRRAVQQAIAAGLASADTTVKVYREGKLIMSGDEILKREKDLKFGDVFRLEGVGRSIEMAIPLLPRGEFQGRTPRFSGDEMALQAGEMPETVKYMIQTTRHNTAIYRDVINLARGGIPQSREKEVISLNRDQRSRLGQRYETFIQQFASAAGLEQPDPWAVPEEIKRKAVKAALQEEFPTMNPRELGHKFLKLDEYTVLEPLEEIYQLSHPDLSGKEKTKIVRSWFSSFEGTLQNPSRTGKDRSYVAHEALRKEFASDEGVQKAASSFRVNAHHIVGRGTPDERVDRMHAWEGPYQIAEEVPAGHVLVGSEVMKRIYKLAYGKLDRNEFHAWEKEVFENAAGVIERRPGVSMEQAGQTTRIIPQRFARSIGLNPASWDKSAVFVSGGTSMASRQNADSDADRLILAFFPDTNKLPAGARQEIKDTLLKTMTGHYIEEMASSRYPREYDPSMSPERAALIGGRNTQIEIGKEVRDIEEWGSTRKDGRPGWAKDTHVDYTRSDGSRFSDDPDPMTKIFLPHRISYEQLDATFRRQVQFKNVDVGFAWVYSPTGRFTSENLTKNKKLARQIQTAGAMNYQEALDVGTIIGRRVMDMAKTMTLKGTFRPSDQDNPVELNAQSDGGLLPKASPTTGLVPNLAYAAVEEYKNGTLTAERTALKFIPMNDNDRLARMAVELKRSETDPMAANINIKNLLGELQDEGIYTGTIAGQLILHQRAQKWLESDDFKYQTPTFQAAIKRAARVMSAIEGQSGSKPLNQDNLQSLIDSGTSYGVVAQEMIGEFIPIPIVKQVGRLGSKNEAQSQSEAAHRQYWTQFEQIMNRDRQSAPDKTWMQIAIDAKSNEPVGMNARSPSQLGQGPIDIFERNLVSDENRTYFYPDYVRRAMIRGNIAEEIVGPYFKSKGYDMQRHTFDISEDTRSPMIRAGFSGLLDLFRPETDQFGAEIYDIKTTSQKEYVAQRNKALQFSTAQEIASGKSHILAPAHRWPQLLSYLTGQVDATAGIKYLPKEAWEEVNNGQLEDAIKMAAARHPINKQGASAKKAMEADIKGMIADGTIDINAISAELVKRMVTARVPENSIILKYALDYYNQVNGVMMNLQERGEIPRQLEDTDPEWIKAYKDAKPKSTSETEARGLAFKNAAGVYAKRFQEELDSLQIPTGDKYDTPFLIGTPLENDHKVIIELPDVDKSVIDKTHGTIEQMLRDQKLRNPMVVRTTGNNTTVLEFSVPSSAQQAKDRSLSGFNWEGWLASDVAPMVKALSPYSSFSMHSPPDQNNPDPLSTVRSLRDRYLDILGTNKAQFGSLDSIGLNPLSSRSYHANLALDPYLAKWNSEMQGRVQPMALYHDIAKDYAKSMNFSPVDEDEVIQNDAMNLMASHAANIFVATGQTPMFRSTSAYITRNGVTTSHEPPRDPNDPNRELSFAEYTGRFEDQSAFFNPQDNVASSTPPPSPPQGDDQTGSIRKKKGSPALVVNSGSGQSAMPPPPPQSPPPPPQQQGGQAPLVTNSDWWTPASRPYEMFGQNTGYREAIEISSGLSNKIDGQNAGALRATDIANQYQKLNATMYGPQNLEAARATSMQATKLQSELEETHKIYRAANGGQDSPILSAEHLRLGDVAKGADQVAQAFLNLREQTIKTSQDLDQNVGQKLKDSVSSFADTVQQRGLNKKELQDLVEARDKLMPAAQAGSGLAKELIDSIDRTIMTQTAKARMGEAGYEEPDVSPRRTRLQKAKEAGSSMEDMVFGNTAFRIRMGLSLTTGNQKQWMNDFMQQQQMVSQAGLMMGAGPSGTGMSTYVQAMNKMANRSAELGEGAAQVMVPMQSFLAGAGGNAGVGAGLTLAGNAAGVGMTMGYLTSAAGRALENADGRVGSAGKWLRGNAGWVGLGAAAASGAALGYGYISGESNQWEKYDMNSWSSNWRWQFSADRQRYLESKGYNQDSTLAKIMSYASPRGATGLFTGNATSDEKQYQRGLQSAWEKTGEGKTYNAEQWIASEYSGVQTGPATIAAAYLARAVGENPDNLSNGTPSPTYKKLLNQWMNFTSAGLSYQQISELQDSTMKSQGIMPGAQQAMKWFENIGARGPENAERSATTSAALSGMARLEGRQMSSSEMDLFENYYLPKYNNNVDEAKKRMEGEWFGAGTADVYRTDPATAKALSSGESSAFPGAREFTDFEQFRNSMVPGLMSAGATSFEARNYSIDAFNRGLNSNSYEADSMLVTARQVSIETGKNAVSVMNDIEGLRNSGVAQGSWGEGALKLQGKAGLAPYGMPYGSVNAAIFESGLTMSPDADKFQGPATSILRAGGRGMSYSQLDVDRVVENIKTWGTELSRTFEDMNKGVSEGTLRQGYAGGSARAISISGNAQALFGTSISTAQQAEDLQNYAVGYMGSVPMSADNQFMFESYRTQQAQGSGALTANQAQTQMEYAGMTTPLALAQYFGGTMSNIKPGVIPNGIPGMQTLDEFGLSYGQYTPWTNVAAMMSGEGRDLGSLTAQYQGSQRGWGTEQWNALQAKYQEAPMYQQQAQVQIAQIGAQIASSQIEYNATYGGGGYVGSANFARKLQWGEGPSVTPSEVYAERQRQQTEYKLANLGVENPKPFEFNPQMGSSTVSVAQQESAIRREMAQTQMQWRKEDIGFAMQGLDIQRQQLALARQQLALSKQEAEITRAYKLEERDTQRGVSLMQRSWTQADWSKNRGRFAVETQWQEEDFSRNIRFTTGREYINARREQERTRTRRGWQQEDTNTSEDRQKQLWKVEDDRYQKAIEYENQIWEIQQQKFALQAQGLDLQQQSIDLQAAQQAAQMARLEQQQKWQDEEWKLEDKRWELEKAQFDEQLKKGQEVYNVRMGVLNKELELAQTQGQHEAGIAAALVLQNDLAGKLGQSSVVTGADAIIRMINAIVAQYGALGPGGTGTEPGDTRHAAGGMITLPTKLVRGGRVVGLMAERGPEAIVPLSSMMPRSNGSSGTTVVQFILDGEVIMEKVVTPDRLSPVMKEVNERTRWR